MRQQECMHRNVARSDLVTIPRAHHAANLDNPKVVNQAIEDFLKKADHNQFGLTGVE
jgi:pimeloyl-ACP methyl ester carboxylesterase